MPKAKLLNMNVEYVQCPYCYLTQNDLRPVIAAHSARVTKWKCSTCGEVFNVSVETRQIVISEAQ